MNGGHELVSSIDPLEFRRVCAQFPTGVTIVTAVDTDGAVSGMTASAFLSVSLEPLLVLISLARRARMAAVLSRVDRFAVSVLGANQRSVSRFFASQESDLESPPFEAPHDDGPPLISGALAWFMCEVIDRIGAGDHMLFISRPVELWADARRSSPLPLVFCRGDYHVLEGPRTAPINWSEEYLAVTGLP